MRIHVRVFSYLREYLPPGSNSRGELDLDLPDRASLMDLFITLGIDRRLGPGIFETQVDHAFQVMVNQAAVNDYAYRLTDGDDVVMFPPMAGG